jgi:hypothetical protein
MDAVLVSSHQDPAAQALASALETVLLAFSSTTSQVGVGEIRHCLEHSETSGARLPTNTPPSPDTHTQGFEDCYERLLCVLKACPSASVGPVVKAALLHVLDRQDEADEGE